MSAVMLDDKDAYQEAGSQWRKQPPSTNRIHGDVLSSCMKKPPNELVS